MSREEYSTKALMSIDNRTLWSMLPKQGQQGFQEVWYLKLNDVESGRALWLRFTILTSKNGFKNVAETWAIFFERKDDGEIAKVALKQSFDIQSFSFFSSNIADSKRAFGVRIGPCEYTHNGTKGIIQSKGRTVSWNFNINRGHESGFNMVPTVLTRLHLVKNKAVTVEEDLRFTGTCEIDGKSYTWNESPGMQGHLAGPKNGHSWVWAHCNTFSNEAGERVPSIFDGLTAKSRLQGSLTSPPLSTFYFYYNGKDYYFNSLWDSIRTRSRLTGTDWLFQADRGELTFKGHAKAETKNFAGVTYEDTDGSFLYCSNSKLADLTILIYRKGKLENSFNARGTAAFEIVSRTKNPYIPLLI